MGNVRDQGFDRVGERFAEAGFGALLFDYRHWGESGGEPRCLESDRRQRQDVRAAIAFARSLDWVDPSRIALWGYSMGGAHVQAMTAGRSDIAAAICIAPVVDVLRTTIHIGGYRQLLRTMAAGIRDHMRALTHREPYRVPIVGPPGTFAVISTPNIVAKNAAFTPPGSSWRNEVCARAFFGPRPYRLLGKARRISCPILYCIAENDDANPPDVGRKAAERAPRGELRLYPGEHVDPFLGENFERLVADQIDFLNRWLTVREPARVASG